MINYKLNNSYLGYIWQNEFCLQEKLIVVGFLFRVFVEYLSFFVLLGDHHSIAKALFNTSQWYPATIYFELLFTLIFSFAILLLASGLYLELRINARSIVGRAAFMMPVLFLIFFHVVLHLQTITIPWVFSFVILVGFFVTAFAIEKLIILHSLMNVIRSKLKFNLLIRLMFLIIVLSLIGATFLHKLTMSFTMNDELYLENGFGNMAHPSTYKVMFIPLLALNLMTALIEIYLSNYKQTISKVSAKELWTNIIYYQRQILARTSIGILIGAFLVEWYFILPILLQSNLNLLPDKISSMILTASILSLGVNLIIARFITNISTNKLFISLLVAFILAIIFVTYNLYYKHLVFLCVLFIALFYNSLQSMINKLIHYEIMNLAVSVIFLVIGTEVSLVWSGFLTSGTSVFLANYLNKSHHVFVIPIVISPFILLNLIGLRYLTNLSFEQK